MPTFVEELKPDGSGVGLASEGVLEAGPKALLPDCLVPLGVVFLAEDCEVEGAEAKEEVVNLFEVFVVALGIVVLGDDVGAESEVVEKLVVVTLPPVATTGSVEAAAVEIIVGLPLAVARASV